MRRYPVRSSALRAIGYDFATSTLEVEFASGGVYDDEGVPPEEALRLLESDSLGRWFAEHIRGAYPGAAGDLSALCTSAAERLRRRRSACSAGAGPVGWSEDTPASAGRERTCVSCAS